MPDDLEYPVSSTVAMAVTSEARLIIERDCPANIVSGIDNEVWKKIEARIDAYLREKVFGDAG